MYDFGIIGAGPAGATLARLLGCRCRVLLLGNGSPKCCGGILSPESQRILAELDLALPKKVLANPQPFNVAVLDLDNNLIRHFSRKYINIHRESFDQWLVSLIPSPVDFVNNVRYQFAEKTDNGFTLHFIQDGTERTEHVRRLVGADGAFSAVRRQFFDNVSQPKRYIAVQHWYEFEECAFENRSINFMNDYVGIFDSQITDFYAWTIPKGQYLVFGAALPIHLPVRGKIEALKQKLTGYSVQLGEPVKQEAGQIVRPQWYSSMYPGNSEVMLIGEAAGLISPSSAEGISSAMYSAALLAEAFDGISFDSQKYHRRLRKLRRALWLKNLKNPAMFSPLLRKLVLLSGLTAIK